MTDDYRPGDDCELEFEGIWHRAEILHAPRHGWCMAVIEPDPMADYGAITARMDPTRTTVIVPLWRVRKPQ